MAFVIPPGRNKTLAAAWAAHKAAQKSESKSAKKPGPEPEPESKNAPSPRAKGGKKGK